MFKICLCWLSQKAGGLPLKTPVNCMYFHSAQSINNVWYKSQLGIFKMSGRECVHSPCSKGWPLTAVAFILRASLADVSQCEPLLVSWSLSAWSLSPWPLSRRLARSASLNVELQHNRRRKKNYI